MVYTAVLKIKADQYHVRSNRVPKQAVALKIQRTTSVYNKKSDIFCAYRICRCADLTVVRAYLFLYTFIYRSSWYCQSCCNKLEMAQMLSSRISYYKITGF